MLLADLTLRNYEKNAVPTPGLERNRKTNFIPAITPLSAGTVARFDLHIMRNTEETDLFVFCFFFLRVIIRKLFSLVSLRKQKLHTVTVSL